MTTGALERIRSAAFDIVVIQPQSTEPVRPLSGFTFCADMLVEEIVATGARVLFFVTWAREAGHPDYERLGLGDPTRMTNELELYARRPYATAQALVGRAFQIAIAELPEVDLYDVDGSHPSPAGSLLAACVLTQMVAGNYAVVPVPAPLGCLRPRPQPCARSRRVSRARLRPCRSVAARACIC
jgi:hypothetical protein